MHTLKAQHWMIFLALCSQEMSDVKNGYVKNGYFGGGGGGGGGGNLE